MSSTHTVEAAGARGREGARERENRPESVKPRSRSQMTVRSPPSRYNDIFFLPNPRTISGTFLSLSLPRHPLLLLLLLRPPTSSLFLLFLRTIRHRSLSCVAVVVEQEETDWHSVDDGAHIDGGVPSSSSFPTGTVLLLERGPRFRVSFFSSEPIFNLRAAAAPAIAGPGVIDVEIIIGERSRSRATRVKTMSNFVAR